MAHYQLSVSNHNRAQMVTARATPHALQAKILKKHDPYSMTNGMSKLESIL